MWKITMGSLGETIITTHAISATTIIAKIMTPMIIFGKDANTKTTKSVLSNTIEISAHMKGIGEISENDENDENDESGYTFNCQTIMRYK
jgi:hypothetical protein